MEVTLSPELEDKLARLADQRGSDSRSLAAELVSEGLNRMSEYDAWFIEQVEEGLAQAKAGQTLTHEHVGDRLNAFIARRSSQADPGER